MEFLPLEIGALVVVYHREGRGWDFGARPAGRRPE